jgi:hypothetical protein
MRERRKAPRFAFGLTGQLHQPGERVGTKVVVRIISTNGCAVEGGVDLGIGKKCEVYFDWHNLHVGVEAEVTSMDSTGRMGLRFLALDRDMQGRLKDICDTLRERAMAVGLPKQQDAVQPLAGSTTKAERPAASERRPTAIPEPPAKRERRQVPRYVSELQTRISNPTTGTSSDVALVTLSVLGGCIEGSALPEPGQPCELTTDWEGRPLKIQGRIVWKSQRGQAGIVFELPDKDAEKLLRQILSNLRIKPMESIPPEV